MPMYHCNKRHPVDSKRPHSPFSSGRWRMRTVSLYETYTTGVLGRAKSAPCQGHSGTEGTREFIRRFLEETDLQQLYQLFVTLPRALRADLPLLTSHGISREPTPTWCEFVLLIVA